jgi:hypothetical protein
MTPEFSPQAVSQVKRRSWQRIRGRQTTPLKPSTIADAAASATG